MDINQALRLSIFQEQDARSPERKHLNEILDDDNCAECMDVV